MLIYINHTHVKFKIKKLKVSIYKSKLQNNEYIYTKKDIIILILLKKKQHH